MTPVLYAQSAQTDLLEPFKPDRASRTAPRTRRWATVILSIIGLDHRVDFGQRMHCTGRRDGLLIGSCSQVASSQVMRQNL